MTYNDYLADCLDFSKASWTWSELDPRKPFITTDGNGWQETCDNSNGGIDVSWAFHLNADKVRAAAPQKFADAFTELLQLSIDDDARDPDQLQAIVDLFV
uniref:Uncharacterized protein n=1 Tax=Ackermannviridae sp. TaxID=2831612 RepID=A0A8S5RVH3_9CAUD|nr:MAG TPA: hypothetical protein [Ackermannviridae sp.]